MLFRRKTRAFSLIEVVLAVGIFAVAVVAVLAMLPALTRQSIEAEDSLVAQRLPDSIRVELQRLVAVGGFDALATHVPIMAAPLIGGFEIVGNRDGSRVHAQTHLVPASSLTIPDAERYFLIEAWRFNSGTLAYDSAAAMIALEVRVSWPYRVPDSTTSTDLKDRQQISFTVSVLR
ncbi:prepilin-type N-terminal cleavage/methylation domain-containing protein [Oleiharenicola lentus]|uniref:prepilin-type N-terminal cleavage/methylation domain-containing protein n=1 Tax=Oleiharenicola lentus TaxID=2508720 RepID=UPI003F6791E5